MEEHRAVWQIWVDTERHVVSFHPIEGAQLLEFYDREMFVRCVDEYTARMYRYQ